MDFADSKNLKYFGVCISYDRFNLTYKEIEHRI